MLEINNFTNSKIDGKSFSQVAKKVLKGENRVRDSLSLAFVSKVEIKKLNKKFRKKNKPTDVLSFELRDRNYLGEVVICPEVVEEEGEDVLRVFVHGILHLCGYDHENSAKEFEKMEKNQEKYLDKLK